MESAKAVSDEANGVDTKIIAVFGIASAIVGIAASVATNLVGSTFYWPNLPFYLALASYVWVFFLDLSGPSASSLLPASRPEDIEGGLLEPPRTRIYAKDL